MTPKELQDPYAHDVWAERRTLEAVSALSEEQFKRNLGSKYGGAHATLCHLCGADLITYYRLQQHHG